MTDDKNRIDTIIFPDGTKAKLGEHGEIPGGMKVVIDDGKFQRMGSILSTIYCPACDTPLVVHDEPDEADFAEHGDYCVSVECPLCGYERTAVEATLCECWAIIDADMERKRRI